MGKYLVKIPFNSPLLPSTDALLKQVKTEKDRIENGKEPTMTNIPLRTENEENTSHYNNNYT